MFYTPSTITISDGEKINGTLTCAPNTRNNRDLDITIEYTAGEETTRVEYKMCVLPSSVIQPETFSQCVNADRLSGRNRFYSITCTIYAIIIGVNCIRLYIPAILPHLYSHVRLGLTEIQVLDVYPLVISILQPSVHKDISHVVL